MWNVGDVLMIAAASFLLLMLDWLAFHDLREAHTVWDWVMLFASILVVIQFARVFWNSKMERR